MTEMSAGVRDSSFEGANRQDVRFLARFFGARAGGVRLARGLAGWGLARRRFRSIAFPEAFGQSQRIDEARVGFGLNPRNNPATIMIQNVRGDVPQRHPIVPFANGVLDFFHGGDEPLPRRLGLLHFQNVAQLPEFEAIGVQVGTIQARRLVQLFGKLQAAGDGAERGISRLVIIGVGTGVFARDLGDCRTLARKHEEQRTAQSAHDGVHFARVLVTFDGEMLEQAQNTIFLGGLSAGFLVGVLAGNLQTEHIAKQNIHIPDFPGTFSQQAERLEQPALHAL